MLIFVGVAQLDSASDSDSEGRGFESHRLHLIICIRDNVLQAYSSEEYIAEGKLLCFYRRLT